MADLEPIIGRYLTLTLGGRPHRVYFEEAGQGIPLVCLHTAGADGKQYRHLLNDREITRNFRVLAFDMPWHGKSLPPAGWQDEEYRLTASGYIEMILAFCDALALERAGGAGLLHRRQDHAGAGAPAPGALPRAHRRGVRRLSAALVRRHGVAAPARRARRRAGGRAHVRPHRAAKPRRDALGHALGLHAGRAGRVQGRLCFYRIDGDFRDRVGEIDTARCPLYLLTGEYDFSCTPDDTRATAEKIPGARFTEMKEIGHFPMSENPEQFRKISGTGARARSAPCRADPHRNAAGATVDPVKPRSLSGCRTNANS